MKHEERVIAFREAIDDIDRALNIARSAVFRLIDAELDGATDTATPGLLELSAAHTMLERQFVLFAEPEQRRQEVRRDTSDGPQEAGGAVQVATRRGLAW